MASIETNNTNAGDQPAASLARLFRKCSDKLMMLKTGKFIDRAKKNLVHARRKHFGKRNLKLNDPEPRMNPVKRLMKSWFRPQGAVNKGILACLTDILEWQKQMEKKMDCTERTNRDVSQKLSDISSKNPVIKRTTRDLSHFEKIIHDRLK